MTTQKRLYRDTENGKISGVCAGLSDYFDLDVTLIRVIWLILLLCAGTGLLAYIIMAIVVDPKNIVLARAKKEDNTIKQDPDDDDPFAKYDK
ncbi:MAG: PspC domain-containing protein [Tenericutes bacterium]|nr:PspC domain-containing protein [Mycoplasmatota bacterium]